MVAGPTDHQAVQVPMLAYYIRQDHMTKVHILPYTMSPDTHRLRNITKYSAHVSFFCHDKMQNLTWNLPSPERLGKVLRFQEMYSMQR